MSAAEKLERHLALLKLAERGRAASPSFPHAAKTPAAVDLFGRLPGGQPERGSRRNPCCPRCGDGGALEGERFRCPDCGLFDPDGCGGWLRRPHCPELACRELLGLSARVLVELPAEVVLEVERAAVIEHISTREPHIAASLRQWESTVGRWLESHGARLLAVQVLA